MAVERDGQGSGANNQSAMRRISRNAPIPTEPVSPWRVYAIGLSAGAGFIHLMAAPEHFALWWGYGLFFLVAAAAQIVYGVTLALDEPSLRWLKAGLLGNSVIIGLYLVTRTVGIPLVGPARGVVEPVGLVDVISKAAELGLVVSLVMMYRGGRPSIQAEPPTAK